MADHKVAKSNALKQKLTKDLVKLKYLVGNREEVQYLIDILQSLDTKNTNN